MLLSNILSSARKGSTQFFMNFKEYHHENMMYILEKIEKSSEILAKYKNIVNKVRNLTKKYISDSLKQGNATPFRNVNRANEFIKYYKKRLLSLLKLEFPTNKNKSSIPESPSLSSKKHNNEGDSRD